jgi:hypothetical protein
MRHYRLHHRNLRRYDDISERETNVRINYKNSFSPYFSLTIYSFNQFQQEDLKKKRKKGKVTKKSERDTSS